MVSYKEQLEIDAMNKLDVARPEFDEGLDDDGLTSSSSYQFISEDDFRNAMPKIRAKLYSAAMNSDDPKLFVPILSAITKMFPSDTSSDKEKQLDIEQVLGLMTEEQLTKIEEMCR